MQIAENINGSKRNLLLCKVVTGAKSDFPFAGEVEIAADVEDFVFLHLCSHNCSAKNKAGIQGPRHGEIDVAIGIAA